MPKKALIPTAFVLTHLDKVSFTQQYCPVMYSDATTQNAMKADYKKEWMLHCVGNIVFNLDLGEPTETIYLLLNPSIKKLNLLKIHDPMSVILVVDDKKRERALSSIYTASCYLRNAILCAIKHEEYAYYLLANRSFTSRISNKAWLRDYEESLQSQAQLIGNMKKALAQRVEQELAPR